MNYREILEFLINDSPRDLPKHAISEIFDRMIWISSDNGQEILNIQNEWLMGNCEHKILIALLIKETLIDKCILKTLKSKNFENPEISKLIECQISDHEMQPNKSMHRSRPL